MRLKVFLVILFLAPSAFASLKWQRIGDLQYPIGTLNAFGPNCYNNALKSAGLISSFRHSSDDEFQLYMASPLCRKLSREESHQVGDIGTVNVFVNGAPYPEHAFYLVSPDEASSKNGRYWLSPYVVASEKSILDLYEVPSTQECRKNSGVKNTGCTKFTEYFRCSDLQAYLKQRQIPSWYPEASARLSALEAELESHLLHLDGVAMTESQVRIELILKMNESLEILLSRARQMTSATPDEMFLWKTIFYRAQDSVSQMNFLFDVGIRSDFPDYDKKLLNLSALVAYLRNQLEAVAVTTSR